MSDYTDKVLRKIQNDQKAEELKKAETDKPITMASSDDMGSDLEIGSSFTDDEYAEDIFNDNADIKDHDTDGIVEDEDNLDDMNSLDELKEKQHEDKKKKKRQAGIVEDEESSDISAIDRIMTTTTYDEEIAMQSQMSEQVISYNEVLPEYEDNIALRRDPFETILNNHVEDIIEPSVEPVIVPIAEEIVVEDIIEPSKLIDGIASSDLAEFADGHYEYAQTETPVVPDNYMENIGQEAQEMSHDELITLVSRENVADMLPDEQIRAIGNGYVSSSEVISEEYARIQNENLVVNTENISVSNTSILDDIILGQSATSFENDTNTIIEQQSSEETSRTQQSAIDMEVGHTNLDITTNEVVVNNPSSAMQDTITILEKQNEILLQQISSGEHSTQIEELQTRIAENDRFIESARNTPTSDFITLGGLEASLVGAMTFDEKADIARQMIEANQTYSENSMGTSHSERINEDRDIQKDKRNNENITTNASVELNETEKTQSDFKEHNLHEFATVGQSVLNGFERAGNMIIHQMKADIIGADKNTQAAEQSTKRLREDAVAIGSLLGLAVISDSYKDSIKDIGKAGSKLDGLIREGKMSYSDLSLPGTDLKTALRGAGVSRSDRNAIANNQSFLSGMVGVRDELVGMKGSLDPKMVKDLQNGNFFDTTKKSNIQLMNTYFNHSTDDVIRKKLGGGQYSNMKNKDFRNLTRTFDINEISKNGQASIKMAQMMAQAGQSRRKLSNGSMRALSVFNRHLTKDVTSSNRDVQIGTAQMKRLSKTVTTSARFGKKILIGTKKGGYHGLLTGKKFGLVSGKKGVSVRNILKLNKKILIGTKKGGYQGVITNMGRLSLQQLKNADMALLMATGGRFSGTKAIYKTRQLANEGLRKAKGVADLAKKKALDEAKKAKDIIKKGANKVLAKPKAGINAGVAKYKEMQKKAKELATKAMQTKAGRIATATAHVLGKGGRIVGSIIATPFKGLNVLTKKLKQLLARVINAFNIIKKYIIIGVCIIIAIWFLVIMILGLVVQLSGESTIKSSSTILFDADDGATEGFVKTCVDKLNDHWGDRKDIAEQIGNGTPYTTNVYAGHTIANYGHPKDNATRNATDSKGHKYVTKTTDNWIKGYKIYYTDKNGNIITNGQNNIKDVIILSYVQCSGEWNNKDQAFGLQQKYFDHMNPDITDSSGKLKPEYYEESDTYFCEVGCETVYYKCNDSATLAASNAYTHVNQSDIQADKAAGAKFYDTITTNTHGDYYKNVCNGHHHGSVDTIMGIDGCDNFTATYNKTTKTWSAVCNGHTGSHSIDQKTVEEVKVDNGNGKNYIKWKTGPTTWAYCDNYSYNSSTGVYSCNGHHHDHHKSASGTINTPSGCDAYTITRSGNTLTASCNGSGGITHHHGTKIGTTLPIIAPSKTNSFITNVCDDYTTTWYCTGHNVKACYGHKDISIYIPVLTMDDVFQEDWFPDNHTFLTALNSHWEEDAVDWSHELYDADWYELYGIDPSGGFGFVIGESLSPEQLSKIQAQMGGASDARQAIINTAIGSVGQIPYYYGGKPKNGGTPIQCYSYKGNLGTVGDTTTIKDSTGRTIAGLDCFGWCQWVYWTASGSNILPEGSQYTTGKVFNSTGVGNLSQISAADLQIGDLGFMDGHVGMFAGVVDGKMMWIHCNGGANTVSYQAYKGFTKYYRLNGL